MPTVIRLDGFRFFFYSNEGSPLEPAHIHVHKSGAEAKFWVVPEVRLETSDGFDAKTLRKLAIIVDAHRQTIEDAWHDHFG